MRPQNLWVLFANIALTGAMIYFVHTYPRYLPWGVGTLIVLFCAVGVWAIIDHKRRKPSSPHGS